eukprot:3169151-Pleurochrysis_carterae.AAC.3
MAPGHQMRMCALEKFKEDFWHILICMIPICVCSMELPFRLAFGALQKLQDRSTTHDILPLALYQLLSQHESSAWCVLVRVAFAFRNMIHSYAIHARALRVCTVTARPCATRGRLLRAWAFAAWAFASYACAASA